ncbi:MAG: N-acetyl-gamma-glutamyl-phosphate reductase [Deltaproteobacteria bacterium]|nr:N-acetyl-gamma-glutamyl-phosphate reductase [Deltaproteobacteria bacterium]
MACRVAIVGAGGYTGVELLRLLCQHPGVEITCVTSLEDVGKEITRVFPSLPKRLASLRLESLDVSRVAGAADVVFTALPHKAVMDIAPQFIAAGCKVIDLSADFRLKDVAVYERWYSRHSAPDLVKEAVYGLPELYRERIRSARLLANPGCYPTSAILALTPLLRNHLIDVKSIVIDSKSGTSGAGRALKTGSLFCEVNEGVKAYGVGTHRHIPEIEQVLSEQAGEDLTVCFTPHLMPVNRGILSTSYARLLKPCSGAELHELFAAFYRDEPFVRVLPEGELPNVSAVRGGNFCDIGVVSETRTGRVIVVSAIDNLVKGAAGQAVQNMNIMEGFEEDLALQVVPLFP